MLALDANRTRSDLTLDGGAFSGPTTGGWSQPCDLGALLAAISSSSSWPGGGYPRFASIVIGRVAHVSDETSDSDFDRDFDADFGPDFGAAVDDLDPDTADTLAEADRAMREARERLAEVPAEVVITNHVMGLYELAAIHLSASPPDLHQSVLAIDAVACLVDGLGERLGDDYATMQDALNNIRLAFVQIKGQVTAAPPSND